MLDDHFGQKVGENNDGRIWSKAVNSFGAIELGEENMDGMNNEAVLILKYS
jgi:hypothetical protein